jgi:hypothetical protein
MFPRRARRGNTEKDDYPADNFGGALPYIPPASLDTTKRRIDIESGFPV